MTNQLIALLGNVEVGRVIRVRGERLSFLYNESWQNHPDAYPISLSMPLALSEHGHNKIDPFLWGLLPDNEKVIDKWAQQYHVSPRHSFGLIANVGEDCAGAIQFIRPERLEKLLQGSTQQEVQWLDEGEIAKRLRDLRKNHTAWHNAQDTGQFSLAGAQPKIALFCEHGKWGVPSGRTPTSHILKPPTGEWDGHAENEHFCLELAHNLGLIVPESAVKRFQDETAIVITRYDRTWIKNALIRVHQEDMCQAQGIPPTKKYENEGGPSVPNIVDTLRKHSSSPDEDVKRFIDALAYNWLIAGTDAHAKNYSVLIGAQNAIRFAPLYDIASILPYRNLSVLKAKLAMRIGGIYRLRYIGINQWKRLAEVVRMDSDRLVDRVKSFAEALPDNAAAVKERIETEGLKHPLISKLADRIAARSSQCRRALLALKK